MHLAESADAPGSASSDARVDAMPDARSCTGGDMHMVAPDGSCFVLFTGTKIYVDAKAACAAINAHLAYLKTAALDAAAEPFVGARDTFVGGDDLVEEKFVWNDGTAFTFTNWHTGEPSDGQGQYIEACVVIAGARVGAQWDDRPCDGSQVPTSGKFAYLCQY